MAKIIADENFLCISLVRKILETYSYNLNFDLVRSSATSKAIERFTLALRQFASI